MKEIGFLLLLIISSFGCAKKVHQHQTDHNISNVHMNKTKFEQLVKDFEDKNRVHWQKPMEVIQKLGDIQGKKIMDIGAGTGYFSFHLASKGAKVIAADVDERFQGFLDNKQEELGISAIETRLIPYDNPKLAKEEVDDVIIINTYHHIENRLAYFKKVLAGLKPGGTLLIVDFKKEKTKEGPPINQRLSIKAVVQELEKIGFLDIQKDTDLLPYQYIITAKKMSQKFIKKEGQSKANFEGNQFWNNRYRDSLYAYGTAPNAFFKETIDQWQAGSILLPAEGEGRNAVYAAELGWEVNATDFSYAGQNKAYQLAQKRNVEIQYDLADVTTYETTKKFDVIAFIFLHLSPEKRKEVFRRYIPFLKPDGKIIVEVFNKKQLGNPSGGPKNLDWLIDLEELKSIFSGLTIVYSEEVTTTLHEGNYHEGIAKTSRIIATK